MVQQLAAATLDTSDVMATIDQCEEILSTIGPLATAEAYQELYDDLVRQRERSLSNRERAALEQTIEKVRGAWWSVKCCANHGAATLRELSVHSSQLRTSA
jgi:hypothetical protein